jgi:polyribonucleotide nucleotidyltransferase
MLDAIPEPRAEVNANAPQIITIQIPVDKIGEVIGPKGKKINEIIAMTGAEINIEDDGTVFIGSSGGEGADEAARMIDEIANPRPVLVGETYEGPRREDDDLRRVRQLVPGRDGLPCIRSSGRANACRGVEERAQGRRPDLTVLVEDIDPWQGKISLKPSARVGGARRRHRGRRRRRTPRGWRIA